MIGPKGWGAALSQPVGGGLRTDAGAGRDRREIECPLPRQRGTAIPELLKRVEIKGAILTIDARGTQTAIAQDIVAGEADSVLALKGNPKSLDQAVVAHIDQHLRTDFADCGAERLVVAEKSHGRPEPRIVIPMPAPQTRPGFGRWSGLKTIAFVMRMSQRDGKETDATRYFISSLAMDVKRIAPAVRRHWSLEHTCRGCLDVTYREDESRIRAARLRENFAWLNRCSLSLLKPHSAGKSLALQRHRCGWTFDTLLKVLDAQRTECALALGYHPANTEGDITD